MPKGRYRKGHIVHQNGWDNMTQKEREEHNRYVMGLEKIIKNSVHIGEKPNRDRWNKRKRNVLKYHYFESKIRVGDSIYTVILDTEQFDKDSEEYPRTVSLYNIKGKAS